MNNRNYLKKITVLCFKRFLFVFQFLWFHFSDIFTTISKAVPERKLKNLWYYLNMAIKRDVCKWLPVSPELPNLCIHESHQKLKPIHLYFSIFNIKKKDINSSVHVK